MRNLRPIFLIASLGYFALCLIQVKTNLAEERFIPAFPGAQGFGARSIGGRGGKIIEVTNLNNDGPGSLREACMVEGPRIVVFRVAGEIIVKGLPIFITQPYITIAGQTAPGGGITLRRQAGDDGALMQFGGARDDIHDVIIQYIKFRRGGAGIGTNLTIRGGYNIIIDHSSFEWPSVDSKSIAIEGFDGDTIHDVTIQRCIVAEGLNYATGILMATREEQNRLTQRISLHHNLFAHHAHRNPLFHAVDEGEFINNVVYNWFNHAGSASLNAKVDFFGNYFKAGPWSQPLRVLLHEESNPKIPNKEYPPLSLYIENNLAIPHLPNPDADNWGLLRFSSPLLGPLPTTLRRSTPLAEPPLPVEKSSPVRAYSSVLTNVGDNARLDGEGKRVSRLDRVDGTVINDVIFKTGPAHVDAMQDPQDFGGYPPTLPGQPYADSDKDGMADAWENNQRFDPQDPADGNQDFDNDGYTNVEEFLNGTDPKEPPLPQPEPEPEPEVEEEIPLNGIEPKEAPPHQPKPRPTAEEKMIDDKLESTNVETATGCSLIRK